MRKQVGFSLVELLIVMAIVGILASIAIPSYQHYLKRARFTEVITSVLPYKTAIAMALQEGISRDELNAGQNGIPDPPLPNRNLESLIVEQGVITATATQIAGGYTYILTPDDYGSHWTISGSCLQEGFCKE